MDYQIISQENQHIPIKAPDEGIFFFNQKVLLFFLFLHENIVGTH